MSQQAYKGFKELNCWKEARLLRQQLTHLAKSLPSNEKFELAIQIVRAARSVTANIAEGYGRFTYSDTRRFFIQARGSVTEILDHLTVAIDEKYLDDERLMLFERQCETVFKLINGYIAYLDKERKPVLPTNS